MAIPKSKKNVGLGQAIIKARFKGRSRPRDGDERLVSNHPLQQPPHTQVKVNLKYLLSQRAGLNIGHFYY